MLLTLDAGRTLPVAVTFCQIGGTPTKENPRSVASNVSQLHGVNGRDSLNGGSTGQPKIRECGRSTLHGKYRGFRDARQLANLAVWWLIRWFGGRLILLLEAVQ